MVVYGYHARYRVDMGHIVPKEQIEVEKKVNIEIEGIHITSLKLHLRSNEHEDNYLELTLLSNIEDDNKIWDIADQIGQHIARVLALYFKSSVKLQLISISLLQPKHIRSGSDIILAITTFSRITITITASKKISQNDVQMSLDFLEKFLTCDDSYVKRFAQWYYRMLHEEDLINKFFSAFICLEVWSHKKVTESNLSWSKRIRKLLIQYGISEDEAEKLVKLRCALFHEGIEKELQLAIGKVLNILGKITSEIVGFSQRNQ